jgi:parallel beta-helix repeat protein
VYAQPSGDLATPDTRFGTAGQSFVSAKITHTTLTGNAYGLFISSADGIEVSDSTVERSLIDGVILHRFASNGILERVTSNENAGDGFVLARATQEIRISAATAKNNGNNGITLTGRALAEGPSPSGETIGEYGNNSVANSTFENNKRYGIEVDGGANLGLQNNQVRGGDMGIVVRRGAQGVSVVGNQVAGQARQGISVRDAVVDATVTGNTVESSPLGIYLRDSTATVRGNTVDRVTSHGVTLVGAVKGTQVSYNTVSGTGATAVDAARSHGKITVERNQTGAWHDTRSFWIRLRHAAKPMTLLWLGVVLLVLFSAVRARKLGARGSIRHPYEKQRLLDTTDRGELLRPAPARERERVPDLVGALHAADAPLRGGSGWDPSGVDQATDLLPARGRWPDTPDRPDRPPVDVRPAVDVRPSLSRPEPAPDWKPRYGRPDRTVPRPPDRPADRAPDRLADLLAERPVDRAPSRLAERPADRARGDDPGAGRPPGSPGYEEDATTVLRRTGEPGPSQPSNGPRIPGYEEDATTVLPRPRRSAEDDPWTSYRHDGPEERR